MEKNKKISFISTVSNFKLYKETSKFYPPDIERYVIDGRKGMFGFNSFVFMMESLKDKDIDWLVMIDEDAILLDFNVLLNLIEYMNNNNFLVSGMQDGGVISVRKQSPFAINTYFSVLNFKKLKEIWDLSDIIKNQFIKNNEFVMFNDFIKNEFNKGSLLEDYYCIYFWILRKGHKILYLNADKYFLDDNTTNVLFNHDNHPLIFHTWYGRLYAKDKFHTNRINKVLEKSRKSVKYFNRTNKPNKPIIIVDRFFKNNNKKSGLINFIKRIYRVIK